MRSRSFSFAFAVAVCAITLASSALAADDTKTTTTTSDASASAGASATGDVTTTEAKPTPESLPAQKIDPNDPTEIPGKTYYYVGLRFYETIIPSFMTKLFLAGGPGTVGMPTYGVEGGFRKDGFDIIGALTFSGWGTDPFPAKGKNEADTAYEIIQSNLHTMNLTADFLWSAGDNPRYQFQYGVITGISFVFGDLSRVQSRPAQGDNTAFQGDPNTYVPCASNAAGTGPATPGPYCGTDNNHYGDYKEPSWFNGGSKPNLYATFGPEFAFRWKPVHQFIARVSVGWNIFAGPFFGIAGDYGI
jgi:hypothetical protein